MRFVSAEPRAHINFHVLSDEVFIGKLSSDILQKRRIKFLAEEKVLRKYWRKNKNIEKKHLFDWKKIRPTFPGNQISAMLTD